MTAPGWHASAQVAIRQEDVGKGRHRKPRANAAEWTAEHRRLLTGIAAAGVLVAAFGALWALAPVFVAQVSTGVFGVGALIAFDAWVVWRLPDDRDRYTRLYRGWEVGGRP